MNTPSDPHAIDIRVETTPNPASRKFVVNQPLTNSRGHDFASRDEAAASPLAQKLFQEPQVRGVFVGPSFVTVSARDGVNWDDLSQWVADVMRQHVAAGEVVLQENAAPGEVAADGVEAGIRQVLDEEIRPAVQMDGGDVQFVKFEDGVVFLQLRGACQGCPGAMMTLKMGVETRLQQQFPEVKAVEPVR